MNQVSKQFKDESVNTYDGRIRTRHQCIPLGAIRTLIEYLLSSKLELLLLIIISF